jgi:hypothetical protein
MMVIVEQLVEWRLAGETEVFGEKLPQRHFVHNEWLLLEIMTSILYFLSRKAETFADFPTGLEKYFSQITNFSLLFREWIKYKFIPWT